MPLKFRCVPISIIGELFPHSLLTYRIPSHALNTGVLGILPLSPGPLKLWFKYYLILLVQ